MSNVSAKVLNTGVQNSNFSLTYEVHLICVCLLYSVNNVTNDPGHFIFTCERIRWAAGISHMLHSSVCSQFQWFEGGRMGSSQLPQFHSMAGTQIETSTSQSQWPV